MSENKILASKRTENIRYAIRDIIVLAEQVAESGKPMYYLNIGDPNVFDFDTPPHLIESVVKAMKDRKNGYAPSLGIPEAVNAIRKDAEERKEIQNIQDIFVTTGAAEAIEVALSALLNEGDNFLMPTPGYPLYTAVQSKLECEPNPYYLNEENGWLPDVDDIEAKVNERTKAIILINPNNPTGAVYPRELLEKIVEIARKHNLVILSDEIYDKLLFDKTEMISVASIDKDQPCVTFSGMSKNYMAPGFRLGWGIVSGKEEFVKDYCEAMKKMLRARVSANHPLQYCIAPALEGDQHHIKNTIEKLEKRSSIICEEIEKINGIDLVEPKGSFYAFPKIDVEDDYKFCEELLKETGVVVVPGSGFGQKPGTSHFRIVICPPEEDLRKAVRLIGEFYLKYKETEKVV